MVNLLMSWLYRRVRSVALAGCALFAAATIFSFLLDQPDSLSTHRDGDLVPRRFYRGTGSGQKSVPGVGQGKRKYTNPWGRVERGNRTGPGEYGRPYVYTTEDNKRKSFGYLGNGFNAHVSDKISVERALPDTRDPQCKERLYQPRLSNVSVIIPFYNEHWSTLLRTVHGVIGRTPPHLLGEMILVDDFSSKAEHCGAPLEEYMATFPKVHIVRTNKREGLIRARLRGVEVARGNVLVFMDAHCEVNVNWLPPLLEPISVSMTTVTIPTIDVIDHATFEYKEQQGGPMRGVFDWQLNYKRIPVLDSRGRKVRPTLPFSTPIMPGGVFAIDKEFFNYLGGYDPGLEIWGGEQFELSFKIWQCGGVLQEVPCSRVGHVFRKFSPYASDNDLLQILKNYMRVAEVWMDGYKQYYYNRMLRDPKNLTNFDLGDLASQKALRQRLGCRDFGWFMREVASDLLEHYPLKVPDVLLQGRIQNVGTGLCLDSYGLNSEDPVALRRCRDRRGAAGVPLSYPSQNFTYTGLKEIEITDRHLCFDVDSLSWEKTLVFLACHGEGGNQKWDYDKQRGLIRHLASKLCIAVDTGSLQPTMMPCNQSSESQQWKFTS
ncbi:polypeptide N-acetylgalactosaminyltransferase 10-like [Branchiostoma lanceolatum]|uniref:polypeptide N-acetylgalactosaminyltransferase 10-like n=1 Tax=Branchiostoma lanceolatum TaxID=7740 RepID=UPI003456DFD6